MKKIMMIRALFALAVTLCAAFAAAQQIPDNPPSAQGGTIDQLEHQQLPPPVQGGGIEERIAKIQELGVTVRQAEKVLATETRPAVRGQAINASCNAKQEISRLRQELAALRSRQARTDGKVSRLESSDKEQNKRLDKLDDAVLGVKDKDGKREGGLVKKTDSIYQHLAGADGKLGTEDDTIALSAKNGNEAYKHMAGEDGKVGTEDDTIILVSNTAHDAYDALSGKDGKIGTADDPLKRLGAQIAGAASQGAVWWIGVIAVLALTLSVLNLLRGRAVAATPTSGGAPAPGTAPAAATSGAVVAPATVVAPAIVAPATGATPATGGGTPAPAPAAAPNITSMSIDSGVMAGNEAFSADISNLVAGATFAFEEDATGHREALLNPVVTATGVSGLTPPVGASGLYRFIATNPDGQEAEKDFTFNP